MACSLHPIYSHTRVVQRPVGRGRSGEEPGRGIKNTGIGGCVQRRRKKTYTLGREAERERERANGSEGKKEMYIGRS